MLLSCLGLFGMAEYITRARTREIGIRKVNGGRVRQIIWSLNLGFLKWVGPGILAGIPFGFYFMRKWLNGICLQDRTGLVDLCPGGPILHDCGNSDHKLADLARSRKESGRVIAA